MSSGGGRNSRGGNNNNSNGAPHHHHHHHHNHHHRSNNGNANNSSSPQVSDILSPNWLRRSQTSIITPGAHLQIVWRGFFSLGMFMDQNNLFGDDEGPTTSNALRADSGVSDGNVSLNNTMDGEDETGSDATQILSTGGIGAVESKERHRLMRKGSGGGSGR